MNIPQTPVQQHPASVDAYIRHGWSLVPIPGGTKGPRSAGWNIKENALKSQSDLPYGYGIGLAHAYSGTMALDIDDWELADELLQKHGINIQELYYAPDAVIIDSGRQGRGKLLYAMPFGITLPSRKILSNEKTAYELRCATSNGLTVQDVLPPSVHPDTGQPYRWAGKGNWSRLPTIPTPILSLWQELLHVDDTRTIQTGDGTVDSSWSELRQAIEHVNPDCPRDEWVNIGMSLHWAGIQTGQPWEAFNVWNEWSANGVKYPGERAMAGQWNSFKADKGSTIKLGTLFHIAKEHGWTRPVPDAAELFQSVETKPVEPVTILEGLRPPPPNMDLSLWPSVLATRAQEISDQVGCDPLVPLFAGMSAVCGAVDAEMRLELMDGFQVPPILWLMTLGNPADKKSPGSRPMMKALKTIEAEDRPRFKKEFLDWEGKEAAYASAKKAFLEFSASPDAMLGSDQAPSVPELSSQPVPLKITVSDITSQKLVRHASERPRGMLCYLDEMNSWIRKLTDKNSGEDRSTWVVSYEGQPYEMDRVGAGSIYCENLAVSIYGNIQPAVFKRNINLLTDDGLLQRFIPAILRADQTRLGEPVPAFMTMESQWEQTVRVAYGLPAQVYKLSPEAFQEFRNFQRWYESAKRDARLLNSSDAYMTAFGKLEGTAGRLILMFHVVENPFNNKVSADIVKRVVTLIKTYVIPSFRYALGEVGGMNDDSFDVWMTDHIIHISGEKEMVTLRELKRSARRKLEGKTTWQADQMVLDAMGMLEQCGWVTQVEENMQKHHVIWAINPSIADMFREHRIEVIKAKQRHVDMIYELGSKSPKWKGRKLVKGYDPETMDE